MLFVFTSITINIFSVGGTKCGDYVVFSSGLTSTRASIEAQSLQDGRISIELHIMAGIARALSAQHSVHNPKYSHTEAGHRSARVCVLVPATSIGNSNPRKWHSVPSRYGVHIKYYFPYCKVFCVLDIVLQTHVQISSGQA